MAKRFQHLAPGAKQPTGTSERSGETIPQDERPIETAHVTGSGEKPNCFRSILHDQEKGSGRAGNSSVELGEEVRAEDGEKPLADLSSMKDGGCGGVIHRSGAKHHAVFCVGIHRVRGRVLRAAVAVTTSHLVMQSRRRYGTSLKGTGACRCHTVQTDGSRGGLGLPSCCLPWSVTPAGEFGSNGGLEKRVEQCEVDHCRYLRRSGRDRPRSTRSSIWPCRSINCRASSPARRRSGVTITSGPSSRL